MRIDHISKEVTDEEYFITLIPYKRSVMEITKGSVSIKMDDEQKIIRSSIENPTVRVIHIFNEEEISTTDIPPTIHQAYDLSSNVTLFFRESKDIDALIITVKV